MDGVTLPAMNRWLEDAVSGETIYWKSGGALGRRALILDRKRRF